MKQLEQLAELIAARNRVATQITGVVGRPAQIGHVGEFIASQVFNIQLEESATAKAIDGHFADGRFEGRSVNVKWYAKREGLLDITPDTLPDYYLVLAGPASSASSSRGDARLWFIESVHLFEASPLVASLRKRNVKIGTATSVKNDFWSDAEIYPGANAAFPLSEEQRRALGLFSNSRYANKR